MMYDLYDVRSTCVKAETFPGPVTSSSSCSLRRRGFGDRRHHQRLDGCEGVVASQLDKRTVDHEHDAVDGDGRLSDVSGGHHLPETYFISL